MSKNLLLKIKDKKIKKIFFLIIFLIAHNYLIASCTVDEDLYKKLTNTNDALCLWDRVKNISEVEFVKLVNNIKQVHEQLKSYERQRTSFFLYNMVILKTGTGYQRGVVIIGALLALYGGYNVCANLKRKFVKKKN